MAATSRRLRSIARRDGWDGRDQDPARRRVDGAARHLGCRTQAAAASSTLGALPPATPVTVSVVLTPSDPAGLTAAATAVATPGSSSFRSFMTPAQVAATFGPTPASSGAVRSWLEGEGLHVGPALEQLSLTATWLIPSACQPLWT